MTVIIQFDRANGHATFRGIRMHGADAYFDICRELTDRGWWDEPAIFIDERDIACMTVKSAHACARRYRPNEADLLVQQARREAKKLERAA